MRFPTLDKLRLHKLKHSDHREFLCQNCGRQFKRKDKMREHIKRVHEHENSDRVLEDEPLIAPPSPPMITRKENRVIRRFHQNNEDYERFLYKCVECAIGFKRRGMLVNHLAKKHPDKHPDQVPELNMPIMRPARNYFCLYCDRVYKSSSKRKAHILKAHPGKAVPEQKKVKENIRMDQLADTTVTNAVKIVQTVTDDGGSSSVISSSSSSNIGKNRSGSSKTSQNLVSHGPVFPVTDSRREAVVGKVIASPHACQWCHRQYATRAKLLQHQRKAHLHLMPPEMQVRCFVELHLAVYCVI